MLILGTALWGWTVPRARAFALLDHFYRSGFRQVDAATNYPINKNPEDWRRSEQILEEWIKAHEVRDLEVIMKVGSLNNMRSPEHNLTRSFLLLNLDEYQARFGESLHTFMLHWDNRAESEEIEETFQVLTEVRRRGLQPGLSGIRHPEQYAGLNREFHLLFRVELKHNLLHSDYPHYAPLHGEASFLAYGINAGGLKLNPGEYRSDSSLRVRGGDTESRHPVLPELEDVIRQANRKKGRPAVSAFYQCGMCFAFHSPGIEGIILGCSTETQLKESLQFYRQLQTFDHNDFYENLLRLHRAHAEAERSI